MISTRLGYERYCTEIVEQTDMLRAAIQGADPATPVPTCPGWDLGRLLRHLGGAHRWIETIVRTGQSEPPERRSPDLPEIAGEDLAGLDARLAEGAAQLADTLRAAGPEATVWEPLPGVGGTPLYFARRMAHETLVHRADATLAVGGTYTAAPDVALDAVDEWMYLGSLPEMLDFHPEWRELLGPGRTLHFHATDADGEWFVDLTGDAIAWRPAHEKAAVAVRGPLTDLLLAIYRRRPVREEGIEIFGDEALLDLWLDRVAFG